MATDEAQPAEDTAAAWMARLTSELSLSGMPLRTQAAVLNLARDVAHGSERKYAPLAAYIAGRYAERQAARGIEEEQSLREVSEAVRRLVEAGPPTS